MHCWQDIPLGLSKRLSPQYHRRGGYVVFDHALRAFGIVRRFPQLLILPFVAWLMNLPVLSLTADMNTGSSGRLLWNGSFSSGSTDSMALVLGLVLVVGLVVVYLGAGLIHGILISFDDQPLTWPIYWAETRRWGWRLVGLAVYCTALVLLCAVVFVPLMMLLRSLGNVLYFVAALGASAVLFLAVLLLVRDDLKAGDALNSAWRFFWDHRGAAGLQLVVVLLLEAATALVQYLLAYVPGGRQINDLIGTITTTLIPLIIFAGLLRAYPTPPAAEVPPAGEAPPAGEVPPATV
jgi:hypothetical protein